MTAKKHAVIFELSGKCQLRKTGGGEYPEHPFCGKIRKFIFYLRDLQHFAVDFGGNEKERVKNAKKN